MDRLKTLMWNFFRIMCTRNYSSRFIFDEVVQKYSVDIFATQCSYIAFMPVCGALLYEIGLKDVFISWNDH